MRRTSLLEKDAISTKDKLDEAQRFREMMQNHIGDTEDEEETGLGDNQVRTHN
jgi:hypothetical protein